MSPSIYASFVLFAICCMVNNDASAERNINDIFPAVISRRSSLSAIQAGRQAVHTLLEGTKQTRDGRTLREFLKLGSYRRAMDDFDSVRPNNVRNKAFSNGVYKKTGIVGDRILTLTSRGAAGKPTLEIVQKVEPGKDMTPAFERILYSD